MREWISIKDQLPPDFEYVIFVYGSIVSCGYYASAADGKPAFWREPGEDKDIYLPDVVTHWMFLPDHPLLPTLSSLHDGEAR